MMRHLASAGAADFPAFDDFHANCALSATFGNTQCCQLWTIFDQTIKGETPDVGGGMYSIYEETDCDYVWCQRETPTHHYVDDIIFNFDQQGEDCVVSAKSRSETMSYYDYNTNYCNMWNIFEDVNVPFTNLQYSDCQYHPSS